MKTDERLRILKNIIKIIDNNHELLQKNRWVVTNAEAYEWWDNLDSPEKIAISAILVQQTRWEIARVTTENIFKTIKNIETLNKLKEEVLLTMIRGVSFPRRKVGTIKEFSRLVENYGGLDSLLKIQNREILLQVNGIGEETADSMLLFAGNQKILPITNYLKRVMFRLFKDPPDKYLILQSLSDNLYHYKLFHAGIVSVGRSFCKAKNPSCKACIFKDLCYYNITRV